MMKQCVMIHQRIFPDSTSLRGFFSPGRVNLIGEHIDYNGGMVMPFALTVGNTGVISLREDQIIHFFSANFEKQGMVQSSLSSLEYKAEDGWANYAKGIIKLLIDEGYPITRGFDISILGNLPVGAGLSSSASIEALVIEMMNVVFNLQISRVQMALFSQKVENEYIHVHCGIMDQFIILNGRKDHAIYLNTNTLAFLYAPIVLDDYEIVICNSMVKRGLAGSKYNERRAECDAALKVFQKNLDVQSLCDVTLDQWLEWSPSLKNDILLKRSRHVITENHRTALTFDALQKNDIQTVGKYLYESHVSLRDDYEVSCKELDLLVELAMQNHSIGSRMTGAGFGGCTVNIVPKKAMNAFIANVKIGYLHETGIEPEIIVARVSDGTKEMDIYDE